MSVQKGPIALCGLLPREGFCFLGICTWRVQRTLAALSVTRLPGFSVWTGTLLWAAVLSYDLDFLFLWLFLIQSASWLSSETQVRLSLWVQRAEKAHTVFPSGIFCRVPVPPHPHPRLELVPKSNKCHLKSSVSPPGP